MSTPTHLSPSQRVALRVLQGAVVVSRGACVYLRYHCVADVLAGFGLAALVAVTTRRVFAKA